MLSIEKSAYSAGNVETRPKLPLPTIASRSCSTTPNSVIFVDDDDDYRSIVKAELVDEGFHVRDFASSEAMLASLQEGTRADIIILNWGLDTTNGVDLLPVMRERGIDLPVVVLTDRSSPIHERLALQRGAVDFIDKSRGTAILAARLRLIVRNDRQAPKPGQVLQCRRLTLKTEAGRAYWDDIDVNLTVSEFKIVHLIASRGGEYVPYRQIYDAMHYVGFVAGNGEHGYRANVRSSIKRIRRKFQECDPTFDEIRNYNGFGYCWGTTSAPRP